LDLGDWGAWNPETEAFFLGGIAAAGLADRHSSHEAEKELTFF
jgi:hypothetical protein